MPERPPSEVARETFKLLAARRLIPTPENYRAIYHEIAGTPAVLPFPEEELRRIVKVLPTKTPGQQKTLPQVELAIGKHNWVALQNALQAYAGMTPSQPTASATMTGVPREGLASGVTVSGSGLTTELKEQIARLIENTLPAIQSDDTRFASQADQLLHYIRQPAPDAATLKMMISNFSFRISFAVEDQAAIRATLLNLLNMVFQNIGELSIDDRWLKGQVDALMTAATPPLTLRRLEDVERRLKDVIFKQKEAKGRTLEAQEQMKQMLAMFIERLSQMSESSSAYQGKMEQCARLIGGANTIAEIAPVLQETIAAARAMALDTLMARDQLRDMREKTYNAETEIAKLQNELDRLSAQTRHDPLTGTLNRKGLDEAIEREIANARRRGQTLCVALLDIDNFKTINDQHGHTVGDAALMHLAQVAKESLRPQDSLARFGGEEFVILMPDTVLQDGVEAMTRLQRELTKRYFLQDNEKLLITFSAGVSQLADTEEGMDAVKRADQAMYLAKKSGKNRVLTA